MQLEFDKAEILGILESNRAKHRKVFEEALAEYKRQLGDALEARIKALDRGRLPDIHIRLITPEDHTADYDRMITMVKMHQGALIPMSEERFAQLVMDDWSWKRQFLGTMSTYAAGTVAEVYGNGDL